MTPTSTPSPILIALACFALGNLALTTIALLFAGNILRELRVLRGVNHEVLKTWTLEHALRCKDSLIAQHETEGEAA